MSYESLRQDANIIIERAVRDAQPDKAVVRALEQLPDYYGRLFLVAIGKAAWHMAESAVGVCGSDISRGIVITKYGHIMGELENIECLEAGHPVPDENGFAAADKAIQLAEGMRKGDLLLFLVSGGGSALFEKPLIPRDELADINRQLLGSGASIDEMNAVRKRLSAVKGGRFAEICAPADIYSIVLSDVIGDRLDVIASGPVWPDSSTCEDALNTVKKYNLKLSEEALACLNRETPKSLDNVAGVVTGSVSELCKSAIAAAEELGYETVFVTDKLQCEARAAGRELAEMAVACSGKGRKTAIIEGGETVVRLLGSGRGGRNQELALAATPIISGRSIAVFSLGSDGTDGPTDAAGGYVDGLGDERLRACGLNAEEVLGRNDSYNALKEIDGLIITGPTGTNVNDLTVALVEN